MKRMITYSLFLIFGLSIISLHAMDEDSQKSRLLETVLKDSKRDLACKMFDSGVVQFGTFKLKSGIESPIYIDMRSAISCPNLLKEIVTTASFEILKNCGEYDVLCGVPYGAVPTATGVALNLEKPMVMLRKEGAKNYGTQKEVEGIFQNGATCLLIEDVMTTGGSILESAEKLKQHGLIVKDIVVLMDRQQGGTQMLEDKGYKVHSLLTLFTLVQTLFHENKITKDIYVKCVEWIVSNSKGVPLLGHTI